jgi:hypothetical protein
MIAKGRPDSKLGMSLDGDPAEARQVLANVDTLISFLIGRQSRNKLERTSVSVRSNARTRKSVLLLARPKVTSADAAFGLAGCTSNRAH